MSSLIKTVTITVRYKPETPEERLIPAKLRVIASSIGKRGNGEPKVILDGVSKEQAKEAFNALIDELGAETVIDAFNHGHDLRTRAKIRPTETGLSKTAARQATTEWVLLSGDAERFAAYKAAQRAGTKTLNEHLDNLFEANKEAILANSQGETKVETETE